MNRLQLEIARFLAAKAMRQSRATYQQVGEAVGWGHPNGRGLGSHLWIILQELAAQNLPPLTTILVRKGELFPEPGAIDYIQSVVGNTDIATLQREVFAFNWLSIPSLAPDADNLPKSRQVWLTSFWGFSPDNWGCIGFSDAPKRSRFISKTRPGVLVAIYVTKNKGALDQRGKVVGVMEMTHEVGHAQQFIAGDRWAKKEADLESRGKWLLAVRASRAWKIAPEDWRAVDDIFPQSYASADPQFIGAAGVPLAPQEAETLFQLDVFEVPVYSQDKQIDSTLTTLDTALSPSKAIPPPSSPYWVGETDGPKHLYILRLDGDVATYLGLSPSTVRDKSIIKVGFSRSPMSRRDQIQQNYPAGVYKWTILHPKIVPEQAPYANAAIAIAGEDAMKARLVEVGAKSLGGEFFLADDWMLHSAWHAGKHAALVAKP